MLKSQVQVGKVYETNQGRQVRILEALKFTGSVFRTRQHWRAVNLATKREVIIKSATKLKREVSPEEATKQESGRTEFISPYKRHLEAHHEVYVSRVSPNGVDTYEECRACQLCWRMPSSLGGPRVPITIYRYPLMEGSSNG